MCAFTSLEAGLMWFGELWWWFGGSLGWFSVFWVFQWTEVRLVRHWFGEVSLGGNWLGKVRLGKGRIINKEG